MPTETKIFITTAVLCLPATSEVADLAADLRTHVFAMQALQSLGRVVINARSAAPPFTERVTSAVRKMKAVV
jgi:hypothetical protein